MKILALTLFVFLATPFETQRMFFPDPKSILFRVPVHGKIGFIDDKGQMIIQPIFQDAQEFSEGLCAVRTNGLYGFINTTGTLVIPAEFDYATPFVEGLALIYTNGKPQYINKSGTVAFQTIYSLLGPFNRGRAFVQTHSGKKGIIDREGKLVVDTAYQYIGKFENGVASVVGFNHQSYTSDDKKRNLEVSIINEDGKRLVPYGMYQEIEGPDEGFFRVTIPGKKEGDDGQDAIMNSLGEIIYRLPTNEYSWFGGPVANNIIRVKFPKKRGRKIENGKYFEGYITPFGKEIYLNKDVQYGRDFSGNRAFVQPEDGDFSMINTHGEVLTKKSFKNVSEEGFKDGMALVETEDGWGIIDTTAQFVLPPTFKEVHPVGIVDHYIFFQDTLTQSEDYPKYGLADLKGKVIILACFQYFDRQGFVNGLLKTLIDGQLSYFNEEGKLIWQEEEWEPENPQPLNIDFMSRGYFYAGYTNTGHGNSGAHAGSETITLVNNFPTGALSVVADPDREFNFDDKIKGMTVFVANTTTDTILFNAQDSRLYMKMQARDAKGVWRDIEYLPNSWCGNSYHTVYLPETQYWTFIAPVYEGTFSTLLRVELRYIDPLKKGEEIYRNENDLVIYSNEFAGSINPAQLWRRPTYYAAGIMDPYNE